jgi:hypothetical protein
MDTNPDRLLAEHCNASVNAPPDRECRICNPTNPTNPTNPASRTAIQPVRQKEFPGNHTPERLSMIPTFSNWAKSNL